MYRRRLLQVAAGTGIGVSLAGCVSEEGDDTNDSGSADDGDTSGSDETDDTATDIGGSDDGEDDDWLDDGNDGWDDLDGDDGDELDDGGFDNGDDDDELDDGGFDNGDDDDAGDDDEDDGEDDSDSVTGATLHTSEGDVEIELYPERVPETVENFVGLATGEREWTHPETDEAMEGEPLYDDVLFHRVIEDFMIQTGDPTGTGRGGPGYTFDDEFHEDLRHDDAGIVSMANRGADTNGSQFFITLTAQPHLDDFHSVFGAVTDGMSVVETIGAVETDDDDRPVEDIFLESVTVHRS